MMVLVPVLAILLILGLILYGELTKNSRQGRSETIRGEMKKSSEIETSWPENKNVS